MTHNEYLKPVTQNKEEIHERFLGFPYFDNYLKWAIRDHSPDVYADNEVNPSVVLLESPPAIFIAGNPDDCDIQKVLDNLTSGHWVIPENMKWKNHLEKHFEGHIESHQRILFDSSNLTLEHVLKCRNELPENLRIVPIESKYLQSGIIHDDVTSRFFTVSPFMENGFGFALVDESDIPQGFALTNYPVIGKEIELYFRVGYVHQQEYRKKGIGTTLCTYLIEYCLNNGYTPTWDSAHEVSAHIARKLGYKDKTKWYMYHIL